MRNFTHLILTFVFFFHLSANSQTVSSDYVDGKVYIKLKSNPGITIPSDHGKVNLKDVAFLKELIPLFNITSMNKPFFITKSDVLQRVYEIEFKDFSKIETLLQRLMALNILEYAERVPLDRIEYNPNDPSYSANGWHLTKIAAPAAWDISRGDKNIVVAVVDGAIYTSHPDLQANIWVNPGEIPGNGIDDDGDGYIDDINGWDAADNDNDPNPPATSWNHGTHVSGIVSAVSDNNVGIASIGFSISVMAVKAEVSSGSSTAISHGYQGITYAVDAGAKVINCSWGGTGSSATSQAVIDYAVSKGVLVICAAGNNSNTTKFYPAAYNGVINVAATTNTDAKASFSNYGNWITISAPGNNIYSTVPNTSYTNMSGTSMASPLVAGLCGLMWSVNPTLSASDIQSCLLSTTDNIDAVNTSYVGQLGAGRINADKALQCVSGLSGRPPLANFTSDVTTTCTGVVKFKDNSTFAPSSWQWNFGDGTTDNTRNPTHTYTSIGSFTVSLKVTNANGADSVLKTAFIQVIRPNAPSGVSANGCTNNTVDLKATGSGSGVLDWYDNVSGGNLLYTGSTFTTPVLTSTTTYYVEEAIKYPSQKIGPIDNTIGAGAYFTNNSDRRLYFDVLSDCILEDVKVFVNTPGNRTIEVYNSGGTLLNTKTVNMPAGESRVTLNFNLAPGSGNYIKLNGTVDLYRNTAGAVYPYTIAGLVSITETDAGTPGYYYYFYDWNVKKAPCVSARIPVTATVSVCNGIADNLKQFGLAVYPNPATDQLIIESAKDANLIITDLIGKQVFENQLLSGKQEINISHLAAGVYYLQVTSGGEVWKGKFVKE